MKDLHYPNWSLFKSMAPSVDVSQSDVVCSFIMSIHRSFGLPLFFLRILNVVHCVGFWHPLYRSKTIKVFVHRLCLAELFRCPMLVLRSQSQHAIQAT